MINYSRAQNILAFKYKAHTRDSQAHNQTSHITWNKVPKRMCDGSTRAQTIG